jgi:type VI secretion system FHA domain protein
MWTLLLFRQGDPPGQFLDRRQIDSGQVRIGRSAATCDWVIPDTSGHISREHCTLSAIGLDLFVVDTSTNGVSLNQPAQRIAPQQPVAVRVGDRLLLGDYVLEVATESAGFGAQAAPPPLPASATPAFSQPDAWFDAAPAADPIWGGASTAEVHEFLGSAMHEFLAPPPTAASGSGGAAFDPFAGGAMAEAFSKPLLAAPPEWGEAAFAIPDDWASPAASPGRAAAPPPMPPAAAAPPPPSYPAAASAADPFAGLEAFAPPASFADDPFLASLDAPPAAEPPAERTRPPQASAPSPAAVPAPTPTPTSAAASTGDAGWAAFCEGAGLEPTDIRLAPDAMRRLGVLYRQVVLGLSDLIQERAAFKDEFRVERTQLSFGRNNPLKHLPPLDSAKLLLGEPLPGFMDAEEAVRTALGDVKKHQLAMLAGVQHALMAVFERLAPAEIERVMKQATAERRGFPLRRGIDPWSVYRTVFDALRRDASSNANSVMSVAFREGYEHYLKGA